MLKDKLFSVLKNSVDSKYVSDFKGEVEIKAWKNGVLFYHDGGSNTVTSWARHSNIHLLSGNSFSNSANRQIETSVTAYSRPAEPSDSFFPHTTTKNADGLLVSGQQFFWDYATCVDLFKPTNPSPDDGTAYNKPYFPTKMLFGTGFEFETFEGLPHSPTDFSYYLNSINNPNEGFSSGDFNYTYKNNGINYYSNTIDNITKDMIKTRTVNDISSGSIPEEATMVWSDKLLYKNFQSQTGIDGAIKTGGIVGISSNVSPITVFNEFGPTNSYNQTNDTLEKQYRGIGRPCFIYSKRGANSEISITADNDKDFDNRITFTVVMPEQTNENFQFYPYNGWTLKEAGLFCDASLIRGGDAIPSSGENGYLPYSCMPQGIMMAKRKITPITKTKDVKISISWSLFL